MIFRWTAFLFCCMYLMSCVWHDNEDQFNSASIDSYLPLDDSEYPYAGLPRIVIETENYRQIRDTETEIPARLQIWGEQVPESDLLELSIRGRGNSSFKGMPKYSIKLEFKDKQALFGMPKDRDWALIANSADKTLLKNFITYRLAGWLGDDYTPRTKFVELYLNRKYLGVYLLCETVKISRHRVNILEDGSALLLERGPTERGNETFLLTEKGRTFTVKRPKNPSYESLAMAKQDLSRFEDYIQTEDPDSMAIDNYLDMESYLRYYWIQELSKNLDGAFRRSIYFIWQKDSLIKLGPVWDFDVAYGNWQVDSLRTPTDWYIRPSGWNGYILENSGRWNRASDYWKIHREFLGTVIDSVRKYAEILTPATRNEFKRWPVLENNENWTYKEPYDSYGEAIDSLNSWIVQRIKWIDENL